MENYFYVNFHSNETDYTRSYWDCGCMVETVCRNETPRERFTLCANHTEPPKERTRRPDPKAEETLARWARERKAGMYKNGISQSGFTGKEEF